MDEVILVGGGGGVLNTGELWGRQGGVKVGRTRTLFFRHNHPKILLTVRPMAFKTRRGFSRI